MRFLSPLLQAVLIRRYKRFLAEVQLADGHSITAYCPNTGSMQTCSSPGSLAFLSTSTNPLRKYPFTLELIKENDTLIGVNTAHTNTVVAEAFSCGRIAEFGRPIRLQQEVKTSSNCRLDLALHYPSSVVFVEIKSCTFVQEGIAMFPDAVTERGRKHLFELARLVRDGHQAAVFFLVQRQDAKEFRPATATDPRYSAALRQVHEQGVQILAYQAAVSVEEIIVNRPLPYSLT